MLRWPFLLFLSIPAVNFGSDDACELELVSDFVQESTKALGHRFDNELKMCNEAIKTNEEQILATVLTKIKKKIRKGFPQKNWT